MEKTILFFCDIHGTLEGKLGNRKEDYLKFNHLLNLMSSCNDNCKILFSLVSTEKEDIVEQYFEMMNQYLDGSVYFGKQFYDGGYITTSGSVNSMGGKGQQIVSYIKEVDENSNLDKVYYADDSKFFHDYVTECVKLDYSDMTIKSIMPTECLGLCEVNTLLENSLSLNKTGSSHL